MKACPNCALHIPAISVHCGHCGKDLPTKRLARATDVLIAVGVIILLGAALLLTLSGPMTP